MAALMTLKYFYDRNNTAGKFISSMACGRIPIVTPNNLFSL